MDDVSTSQEETGHPDTAGDASARRPLVVVVGPLSATGGMSSAMRLQLEGPLAQRFELLAFDNSKRTAPDRPLCSAIRAQLGLVVELWALLRKRRPAIVHLHTCSGLTFYRSIVDGLVARACGARVVLHIHGGRFALFLARLWPPNRWVVRRVLLAADGVVVLGRRWARVLRRFDSRIRLSIVYNGVVVPREPDGDRGPCRPTVLCVGNLSRNKGIETLIKAVAGLPRPLREDLEVRIIGHDPENRQGELRQLVRALDLERTIHFLGRRTPREVQEELARATVFALPSRAEALPIALLEAMAQGLPCVATHVGAIPELIRHRRDGLLVAPGDGRRFRDCLGLLLEDQCLRTRLGRAARRRVLAEFSQEQACVGLAGVYEQAILSRGLA